jgi:hypothetical protein
MQRIEKLIEAEIPFAVMNYKKTPAGLPRNAFELVVINPENGEMNILPLDPLDIKLLKSRKHQRQIVIKNKNADGQVYEFMNFKQVYDDAIKEFEKLMNEYSKAQLN